MFKTYSQKCPKSTKTLETAKKLLGQLLDGQHPKAGGNTQHFPLVHICLVRNRLKKVLFKDFYVKVKPSPKA